MRAQHRELPGESRPPSSSCRAGAPVRDLLLKIADLRGADHILVRRHGGLTAFGHAALPGEKLRRRDPCAARDEGNAHAGLRRFFDEADFLGRAPAPTALHRGDDFNARHGRLGDIGHSRIHRLTPMPYRLCPMSGQNGVHFTDPSREEGPRRPLPLRARRDNAFPSSRSSADSNQGLKSQRVRGDGGVKVLHRERVDPASLRVSANRRSHRSQAKSTFIWAPLRCRGRRAKESEQIMRLPQMRAPLSIFNRGVISGPSGARASRDRASLLIRAARFLAVASYLPSYWSSSACAFSSRQSAGRGP